MEVVRALVAAGANLEAASTVRLGLRNCPKDGDSKRMKVCGHQEWVGGVLEVETDGIGFPRHVGIPWFC